MRNLKLLTLLKSELEVVGTAFVVDEVGHRVFVVTNDNMLIGYDLQKRRVCTICASVADRSQGVFRISLADAVSPSFALAGLSFVPDQEMVVLASKEGELVSVDLHENTV